MKEIEKRLNSAVQSSNMVSPLLLNKIKARTISEPVEEKERVSARKKKTFRFTLKATVSACAVFVLCILTVFIAIPLNMKAGSQDPGSDSSPPPDSYYAVSLELLDEINLPVQNVPEFSKMSGLTLAYLDGVTSFKGLYLHNQVSAYKSVYEYNGYTVNVIQSVSMISIIDYDLQMYGNNYFKTYFCKVTQDYTAEFKVHKTADGFIAKAVMPDGNHIYLLTDGDSETLNDIVKEIESNFRYYD